MYNVQNSSRIYHYQMLLNLHQCIVIISVMISLYQYQQLDLCSRFKTASSEQEEDQGFRSVITFNNQNGKLKNELCRNYLQYGFCRYNIKCQFAHGIEELRQNQSTNFKYKTKQCQSYFNKGFCQYGERCNFLHHNPPSENMLQKKKTSTKWVNFKEIIEEGKNKSRFFSKQ